LYLKQLYSQHPVLEETKIISSFYKKSFNGTLDKDLIEKIKFDGIEDDSLEDLKSPNAENLYKIATRFSDGIVFEDDYTDTSLNTLASKNEIPVLSNTQKGEYYNFYQNFFCEVLV